MEILQLQIIFIASIFCGTLLFCLIPLLTLRRGQHVSLGKASQRVLSYLSCAAGGVFIAMCFLGLIPQVQNKFRLVLEELELETQFPVAECVVVLGFFFIVTVEQLCLLCYRPKRSVVAATDIELKTTEDADSIRKLLDADDFDGGDQDILYEVNSQHGNPVGATGRTQLRNGSARTSPTRDRKPCHSDGPSTAAGHNHLAGLIGQKMGLRFFTLVLALSIHAVFEGLALGLQKEEAKAWRLFIAILLHESLCAFALGVNTAKRRLTVCASLKYIVLFCLTIPSGIGIGIALGQAPGFVGNVLSGTMQGFAAGIFIHVTFMEVIPGELGTGKDGLLKVLFLFIGFLIIAAVNVAQEM